MNTIKYVLPEKLRENLKQPLGYLVEDGEELIDKLEKIGEIVTIGDHITATIIELGFRPLFCIVDYKTKREEVSMSIRRIIESYGDKTIRINNPPGVITEELWNVIKEIYMRKDRNIRIEIDGEEDLSALPAIYLAPRDVTIIYGLPDKGVVLVTPDEETKRKVREVLAEM